MASRSWTGKALVVSLTTFGEGHREALLLTEERGLVRAAVFGGAKSKLKSLVSPWHSGNVWIYTDPVKKTSKITDFEVLSYRPGLRENLTRSWCASVCAEIVARSHGSADWRLVNGFLEGIAVSDETECRYALLRFFWRLLVSSGVAPDLSYCPRCSRAYEGENELGFRAERGPEGGQNEPNEILYYSPLDEAFLCESCARVDERRFPLSESSARWLTAVAERRPSQSRSQRPSGPEFAEIRQLLFFLVSRLIDGPLKSLQTADGIL